MINCLNEWKTDVTVTTDADGRAEFAGYAGTYQVGDIMTTELSAESNTVTVQQ